MMDKINNNRFRWSRFWTLLKGHFADGRKNDQMVLLAVFLVSLGLLMFLTFLGKPIEAVAGHEILKTVNMDMLTTLMTLSNTSTVVSIFIYVFLSLVCSNMSNRSGDIAYLMLPATNLEKWLSRVVYVFVVGFVLITAVYYLAVLLCTGIGYVFNVPTLKMLFSLSHNFSSMELVLGTHISQTTINILLMLSYCVTFLMAAMFILGGTYFRRLGWLYTALIGLVLSFVLAFAIGLGFTFFHQDEMIEVARSINDQGPGQMLSLFNGLYLWSGVLAAVLGVLLLWLSYKVFCRRQIESHRIRVIK